MTVIMLGGCLGLQPGPNPSETTGGDPACRSDLSVVLVEEPEFERSNASVFNYSGLSSDRRETFESALNGSAEISKDAFWLDAELVWYDGGYYRPRIQYC
ncbi:hypothetical protein [Haloarchaeobius baliensis]|uniref:hypothetical protein n=1 Tax=Haloarchaeobius baliensis TaxID=1670458 RepID=UPI003F885175